MLQQVPSSLNALESWVSDKSFCARRWLLPAYNMPANASKQKLLRAVVRSDLNIELAEDLVNKIKQVLEWCGPRLAAHCCVDLCSAHSLSSNQA